MKKNHTTTLIAHRGASGETPENTLSAFQKAIDIGADYIEFDVRLTKDNVPVVIHDDNLARTTGNRKTEFIHNLSLSQLKNWDVGVWFDPKFKNEKIPTLKEVFEISANKIKLMIEIKEGIQSPQIIVDHILKTLNSSNINSEDLKFGSFSPPIIKEIMQRSPSLHVMGIIEEIKLIDSFLNLGIKHLALWYKLITPSLAKELQNKNITLWTFTVDDSDIVRFLQSLSIDGIITNQPRLLQHLF